MIPPIQMNQGHLNDMKDIGQGHPEEEKIGQGHPEEEKIGQGHPEEEKIGQGHPEEEKIGQGHPEDEKINLNLIRADVMIHTIALIQKVLIKTDLKKEKKGNIRIWN
jgi:stress response protein SCP2